ncbi:MAG: stage 0 sporulation protein J, partial [Oscillospiraceae bacterium]|nr:stage 0 sporulation protein J [Oscillospiraceae bacterium]
KKLSIPRSSVANSLRILNLPQSVLELVKTGELSLGHAKVVLSVTGESKQLALAQEIAEKNLSVRQAELLAKKMQKEPKQPKADNVPTLVKEIEIALSEMHGTPVKVSYKDGKGSLTITFNSDEQLKKISRLLEK